MSKPTRYTRELLTELAATSTSINDMMRRLGVPMAGGTHSYLSKRLRHYGIDTSHFDGDRPDYGRQGYSKERLAEAAAASDSIASMLRRLGVVPYDSAYGYLRRRLAQLGVDTSHFTRGGRPTGLLPKPELEDAVADQVSIAGVFRALSLADTTTNRRLLKASITQHAVDTSHFTGAAHNRGKRPANRRRPEEVLVRRPWNATRVPGFRIRRALIELGRPERCEGCGTGPHWLGQPLTIEVDHINGDWSDNRPENLRLLCPNCHAVTPTYCRRKKGQTEAPPQAA